MEAEADYRGEGSLAPDEGLVLAKAQGGLGDKMCQLSALREFARQKPKAKVFFDFGEDIIRAFGDDLVSFSNTGSPMVMMGSYFKRCLSNRNTHPDHNLVGTFMAGIGIPSLLPPRVELPPLPGPSFNAPYAVLQTKSTYVRNPPMDFIQERVDEVLSEGVKVIAVGFPTDDHPIKGVDYSFLHPDAVRMLSLICGARIALTPNSATAHVASAYNIQTTVWLPRIGPNWLVNYPGWNRTTVFFD